uniref:Uncharacterized protein n=1 Tax=Arundo donax TaxID=35708 RepID=A0A0A9A2T6_ARUDO
MCILEPLKATDLGMYIQMLLSPTICFIQSTP